jgi:integrase
MAEDAMGFTSSWAPFLVGFIAEKRACGYRYETQVKNLRPLDRWWSEPNARPSLSCVWAERFIAIHPGEAPGGPPGRASLWRELARYGLRQGIGAYIPPLDTQARAPRSFVPYIYTRGELRLLFATVDDLPYTQRSPRRTFTLGLLLRLLYGAGLRLGEALGLRHEDIDSREGILTIHHGKNQKDRLVPLAPSLADRLAAYRHRFAGAAADPLFLSPVGRQAIHHGTIQDIFPKLLQRAGLPPRRGHQGPRLHDLRHTFAVHRLESWHRAGEDLEAKLPILSAYLGHTTLRDTYYYLRITASFFPEITRRLQAFTGDVIPGVQP